MRKRGGGPQQALALAGVALAPVLLAPIALGPTACGARTGMVVDDAGADAKKKKAVVDAGTDGPKPTVFCESNDECEGFDDLCNPIVCKNGTCAELAPVVCDDKDPCTKDRCDPDTGKCIAEPLTFDLDRDGHKAPAPGHQPGDPGSCGDDCDDKSAKAFPGGIEVCDGVDNDCNGIIDDNAAFVPVSGPAAVISESTFEESYGGGVAFATDEIGYLASYTGETPSASTGFVIKLGPQGNVSGSVVPINSTTGDAFAGPVVWTGDRFGTAWVDRRDGDYEVYFNTFTPDGAKIGPDVRVTNAPGFSLSPALGWNGTDFYVVYQDERNADGAGLFDIMGQRITLEGEPVGTEEVLATFDAFLEYGSESPSVAAAPQGIGLVYRTGNSKTATLFFQSLTPDLKPLVAPVPLVDANVDTASIAYNNPDFVVIWTEKAPFRIFGSVVSPTGQIKVPRTQISSGGGFDRYPLTLALGDRLVMVYSHREENGPPYDIYSLALSKTLIPASAPALIFADSGSDGASAATFGVDGDIAVLITGTTSASDGAKPRTLFTRLVCAAGAKP